MKLSFLLEGEFDSPELMSWKIQNAVKMGKEMEGWDVFATTVEQNKNLHVGNYASVAARFFDKDVAQEWALKTEADRRNIKKWQDERFNMSCYIALVEFDYPEDAEWEADNEEPPLNWD